MNIINAIDAPCLSSWSHSPPIPPPRQRNHSLASCSEKAMELHSSTLAWKIPWTEEPGGLQSMGLLKSQTRLSNFTFTFHFHALEKETATHSSVLAWRIPGTGEPGGLPSMGSHRVGYNWSDLAAAACLSLGKVLIGKSVHLIGKYVHVLPLCPLLRFTIDQVPELAALHLGRLVEKTVFWYSCAREYFPLI